MSVHMAVFSDRQFINVAVLCMRYVFLYSHGNTLFTFSHTDNARLDMMSPQDPTLCLWYSGYKEERHNG